MNLRTIYKICVLIGLLMVVTIPFLAWQVLINIQPRAEEVFRENILLQLDLDSLKQEVNALDNGINHVNQQQAAETPLYTESQIQKLREDIDVLQTAIGEKLEQIAMAKTTQVRLVRHVKIVIAAAMLLLAIGMTLTVFGVLGLHYHIKIYTDRRLQPRG
ncbi:MAG: hypothetical protein H0W44_09330 [Gammaproteobacteria bacterium]|nr:hypothetical protein [Gammaproteobacteria bacterium]